MTYKALKWMDHFRALILILALLAMGSGAYATPAAYSNKLTKDYNIVEIEGDTTVIKQSFGGSPVAYNLLAEKAKLLKEKIRFEGVCASACVVMALAVGETGCMTDSAIFLVHAHSRLDTMEYIGNEAMFYPPEFVKWAEDNNAFVKTNVYEEMTVVPTSVIENYLAHCD